MSSPFARGLYVHKSSKTKEMTMGDLTYKASQARVDDLLREAGERRRAAQAKARPEKPSARILPQPGLLRRVALVPIRH